MSLNIPEHSLRGRGLHPGGEDYGRSRWGLPIYTWQGRAMRSLLACISFPSLTGKGVVVHEFEGCAACVLVPAELARVVWGGAGG